MTQPSPQTTPQPFAPIPVFKFLSQYILAAASGDRSAIFHLFVAVFTSARAAARCLAEHYKAHPSALKPDTLVRLKYCAERLKAILFTLARAPERFLSPAQLRALTRTRAILAHLWRQPVDFSPLTPFLTSPENCPPPPRANSLGAWASTPAPAHRPQASSSSAQASSLPASPPLRVPASSSSPASDPLLLRSPGCALVSVLLQLASLYGVSCSPCPARRAPRSSAAAPSLSHHSSISHFASPSPHSSIPQSKGEGVVGLQDHKPQSPFRPPP